MKLVFFKDSKVLLCEIMIWLVSISGLIDFISLSIQQEITAYDLQYMQLSMHPLVTPVLTVTLILSAATNAVN